MYKKGELSDPANFRCITREKVPLKIFTSCKCDSMYAFLQYNGYIEHNIQNGFQPKLSGTFEHTARLANVLNTATTKQRSLVVTTFDLENAFGKVHHNLIPEILTYHHIPEHTAGYH